MNNAELIVRVNSPSPILELRHSDRERLLDIAGFEYFKDKKSFRCHLKSLPADEKKAEANSYKASNQLIINVTYLLSAYPDLVANLDHKPTDLDTLKDFQYLEKTAQDLMGALDKISSHSKAQLKRIGYNRARAITDLLDLIASSKSIISQCTHESRGRKEQQARKVLVNNLREHFLKYAHKNSEAAVISFIRHALNVAKIQYPQNLKRLFYRPNDKRIIIRQVQ